MGQVRLLARRTVRVMRRAALLPQLVGQSAQAAHGILAAAAPERADAEQRRGQGDDGEERREEGNSEEHRGELHEDAHHAEEEEEAGAQRRERGANHCAGHGVQGVPDCFIAPLMLGHVAVDRLARMLAVLVRDVQRVRDAVADKHDQAEHLDRARGPAHCDAHEPRQADGDAGNAHHDDHRQRHVAVREAQRPCKAAAGADDKRVHRALDDGGLSLRADPEPRGVEGLAGIARPVEVQLADEGIP
mmetsp:Transcript_48609/g.125313  ORF Transcript_48609/g.125313 Transcript_48609/m.125313 type:complete len:246 (+) Transcript_48609:424-1161(+)